MLTSMASQFLVGLFVYLEAESTIFCLVTSIQQYILSYSYSYQNYGIAYVHRQICELSWWHVSTWEMVF